MGLRSFLLIYLSLLSFSFAKFSWGSCPSLTKVQNFHLDRYSGDWFEVARDVSTPLEAGECSRVSYTRTESGTFRAKNSQYRADHNWYSIEGDLYCVNNSGQCYVRASQLTPDADYEVLDTDYDHYAVVYHCFNLLVARWELAWILVRDPKYDIQQQIEFLGSLTGIKAEDLHLTRQDLCPTKKQEILEVIAEKRKEY
jgi:lipocalin